MIQSHPYSLTSELFPSPRPGLHITQHCACRLCSPPLLFHTFCLAFKSSSFTYPPDLPTVKKKSWHGITSKRLGKLFRASHGAPFPHRNYCWNKQLWEVAALVDPSLLTISEPLSAIAKTLWHRRAVMIALPSWGRKKKKRRGWSENGSGVQLQVFFYNLERSSAGAEAPETEKVFQTKSHSNLPNSHLGFYGDSTLSNSKWRTSNLLHSRCRVEDAFAEVVSGAWLSASCQHRGLKNTWLFVCKSATLRPFSAAESFYFTRGVFCMCYKPFPAKTCFFVPHLLGTSHKPVL